MRFVISPAKTLDFQTPATVSHYTQPDFLDHSAALVDIMRQKGASEIASLMDISADLAELNAARYAQWVRQFTPSNAKPAVLAFMGDVYEGLNARTMPMSQLDYLQARLRILSGLYGILRPLDLMQPYRLEMGIRLPTERGRDLYAYWGNILTEALNEELAQEADPVLVNLASDEYFRAIRPKQLQARLIHCRFEDRKNGNYKIISFYAKRARGLMVRYAATHGLDKPAQLQGFDLDGYAFAAEVSTADHWVFRREAPSIPVKKLSH